MLQTLFSHLMREGWTGLDDGLWFCLLILCLVLPLPEAHAAMGPTVRELIEFTRIIQPIQHDAETLQSQVSPDGSQAFVVTRTAKVANDVNRFEILLLDLNAGRLAASAPGAAVRVFSVESRNDDDDANPSLREVRWHGHRSLVFRARLHDEPFQVYQLDVLTQRLTQLTYAPLGVLSFDVSGDSRRVVYVAPVPNPAMPPGSRSVVVGTHSFWSVHFGQDSFRTQQRRYQFFVAESGSRMAARPVGVPFPESAGGFPSVSMSPDGRWLVLPKYEPGRQLAWAADYPQIAEATAKYGPSVTLDPLAYYSRPMSYVSRRLVLYRLSDGQEQPILDAPDDVLPGNQTRTDRLWQDGGVSLVIAGTYLPLQDAVNAPMPAKAASASPSSGTPHSKPSPASHIIEFWPDTGRWQIIAALGQRLKTAFSIAGKAGAFMAIDGGQHRRFERGADGVWQELEAAVGPDPSAPGSGPAWRLKVAQSLNQPPDIVAQGPDGAEVRLTQLNPQYRASQWGTMREYDWKDVAGRQWRGGLMVPADFKAGMRYPLVIQPYGFSPNRFYRDGSNDYDGFTSGFAGRAFLREGILVLAFPWRASSGAPTDEPGARQSFQDGVRAAIDALVKDGSVDRERIGILGWSATGERVLNLLTFTDTPIRAATLLDGDANTLYSMTITYAVMDGIQARKERTNGGGPFGESRTRWIRNDPSLYTDCIRAALRIETYGPEAHNNWDIYALLRRQYRPVELLMIPGGAHALARPSERMISLQGNVDWYRFWLKGEQREELIVPGETTASLKEQYQRWQQMETLKQAVDRQPACVRALDQN
ncbi:alpha/beta hydrolase family protein [Roseateles sp.]|uniref:alpha/beta hydrolase family protein n=1 Tax=Roseateles sp. TaxID=1971397 RepID=UPI003D0CC1F2